MNRRGFLQGTAATLLSQRRPNLVFLLVHHWRGQALSAAGDRNVKTPNLDALASGGVSFERAYTANPATNPAHATLLTGRLPHASGVRHEGARLPATAKTIAEVMAEAGYATGHIGKWDLDGGPSGRHGFVYVEAADEADYQGELAIRFIRENSGNPFLLFVSFPPLRPPRSLPPRYASAYSPGEIELRPNVPSTGTEIVQRNLASYYGACSLVDECTGRVLKTLDTAAIAADTIVVFTSTHGDMLGSHGLDLAGDPFEESIRVPLIIRYPRSLSPRRSADMPVSQVDLMPTLLGAAGIAAPSEAQGRDLSEQLLHGTGLRSESVYVQGELESEKEWRAVVRGLDKLVVNRKLAITHLYNLGQDPYELDNLAADPAHATRRDELRAILIDWMQRVGDGMLPSGLKTR